jgi:hypothetical protein
MRATSCDHDAGLTHADEAARMDHHKLDRVISAYGLTQLTQCFQCKLRMDIIIDRSSRQAVVMITNNSKKLRDGTVSWILHQCVKTDRLAWPIDQATQIAFTLIASE